MDAIRVKNICLNYGEVLALQNVSFAVGKGELFGLIGADGAGKTSLLRILATLLLADSGTATVDGFDVVKNYRQIRNCTGYMPGRFSLYQDLTIEENLNFFATVFGTTIPENYHLIEDIYRQIEPFKKRRAGQLSGGMKQKLALSCALIHKPSVLFLDEPTTGVDAVSRKEFWEILKKLKIQGITILVSTPYMDEAAMCDRIAFIQHGKILKINTPKKIVEDFTYKIYSVEDDASTSLNNHNYEILKELRKNPAVRSVFSFGDKLHVVFNAGCTIEDRKFSEIIPTIEDCFMDLLNEN